MTCTGSGMDDDGNEEVDRVLALMSALIKKGSIQEVCFKLAPKSCQLRILCSSQARLAYFGSVSLSLNFMGTQKVTIADAFSRIEGREQ